MGVMASMAQHEREVIGERIWKALAEKKRAGHVLGKSENLTPEAIEKGREVRQRNARQHEHNRRAAALALSLRQAGRTWTEVAARLNEAGFRTRLGKPIQAVQVQRVLMLHAPLRAKNTAARRPTPLQPGMGFWALCHDDSTSFHPPAAQQLPQGWASLNASFFA